VGRAWPACSRPRHGPGPGRSAVQQGARRRCPVSRRRRRCATDRLRPGGRPPREVGRSPGSFHGRRRPQPTPALARSRSAEAARAGSLWMAPSRTRGCWPLARGRPRRPRRPGMRAVPRADRVRCAQPAGRGLPPSRWPTGRGGAQSARRGAMNGPQPGWGPERPVHRPVCRCDPYRGSCPRPAPRAARPPAPGRPAVGHGGKPDHRRPEPLRPGPRAGLKPVRARRGGMREPPGPRDTWRASRVRILIAATGERCDACARARRRCPARVCRGGVLTGAARTEREPAESRKFRCQAGASPMVARVRGESALAPAARRVSGAVRRRVPALVGVRTADGWNTDLAGRRRV